MLQFDYQVTGNTEQRMVTGAEIIINNSEDKVEVTVSNQYLPQLCCKMVDSDKLEECLSASIANVSKSFEIVNNRLTSVKKRTFANLKVEQISLNNNLIETLENDAFYNLTNLIVLTMSRNLLEVLNPEAFSLLPNLSGLNLRFNRLHTLQTGAFEGISPRTELTVDLNGNRIRTLPDDVFSNHTFGQLDLGNNPVKKIAASFCEGCSMEKIYLSCDYLTLEDVEMIRNWAEAGGVRLYTKRRTVTSAEIIINNSEEKVEVTVSKQYLPQLCCKMVDSNNVEGCLSASIANVARSFKITNNRLRSVKKGTFANLKVNTISLSNNLIETLENDAFYNLTNLITLSLSRNLLEVLNPEAFFLLSNLAALDLMFNRIHTLQTGFFKFLTNNVQVLLNCNRISRVEKAFAGVSPRTRLTIDLNGNRIQTLSEDVFSNHTFGQLDLGNNPVKKIAKTFCEGCTMETLYLSCDYLTLEDVEMIRNWAEVALVRLFTTHICRVAFF
ncbi:leucine-rich repeat and immunoglobulin-like domain-containing nogo receptor-interacting protein 2 [Zophobas morio]|uniref:leucine-rich repeat and immunoglobulin-like domain-containing nogo receptor-interacting protein 2 n=1 Tax=Zophobas morio TaxID=2755281 RepID=UPI003083DAAC